MRRAKDFELLEMSHAVFKNLRSGRNVITLCDIDYKISNYSLESTTSSTEWATKSGWKVKCIEPMKKWTISYNGQSIGTSTFLIFSTMIFDLSGKIVRSTGKRVFTAVGPDPEDILTGAEQIPATIEFTWTNFG